MLTILVVDDEKLERKGIRFLLNRRSEEMEILEAANGKAACEILQRRTVDIMLTDIKMPFAADAKGIFRLFQLFSI